MRLVELLLQGVKGFPADARIPFEAGYTVLPPAQTDLRAVLEALFFLDDRPGEQAELGDERAAASRAALTLCTRDGSTFRVVRDLRGGSALQRQEPATGKYVTLSSKASEIGPYLRSQAGLPGRSCFTEVFTLGFGDFPSASAPVTAVAEVPDIRPPPDSLAPPPVDASPERIRALEEELAVAKEIEAQELRLDAIRVRLHELEDRFKAVPKAEAEVEAARRAASFYTSSAPVPEDLLDRTGRYEAAGQRRDQSLARLAEEADRLAESAARPLGTSPMRDWRFWTAAAAGVAVMGGGAFSAWKPLALLGIPAFGVAAAVALVFVGDLQRRDSLGRRRVHLQGRERKIHEQWSEDTLEVRNAMEAVGVERVADLEAWLSERAAANAHVAEAERALRKILDDPWFAESTAQRDRLQVEAAELEGALEAKGAGAWRSASEIAREIDRLQNPDRREDDPTGGFAFGTQAPVAFTSAGPFSQPPVAGGGEDPSARLLDRAAELAADSREALLGSLAPRASAYLAALTRKRWHAFSWSDRGGVRCVGADGERPFVALAPEERDLVWLALRLAIVERQQARSALPMVLDEPLTRVPPDRHPLLAKMLQGLGTRGQVIHCTRLEVMSGAAS